jgi:ribosomal protein S12 methylthiotransferase
MKRISLISLGCPKNSVDSETLIKGLMQRGIRVTDEPEEADILAVNTCGFIEDAKRESIEEILRLSELKSNGKKLVVIGCLAKRYGEELRKEMPEIDALFGVGEDEKIIDYCTGGGTASLPSEIDTMSPTLNASHFRYLKVSEGCSRRCSFCVIPSIRGPHRSRRPEEILHEAESAIESGAKELILVAQDVTAYGRGPKGPGLAALLKDMASISGDYWIRLLYLHPSGIDDELLTTIAEEEKVLGYIDVPLQHSEDRVLRAMKRAGGTRKQYLKLMSKIRKKIPGVALRTTFIVGFPGETEEDFNGLMDFIQEVGFDRLGAFMYSNEEGTLAFSMPGQLPEEVKQRRWDELMRVQADISLDSNRALIGRTFKALVDLSGDDEAVARIYSQAPEIDGHTVFKGGNIRAGGFIKVKITGASDYDLEGVPA